jgi:nitroreductase
MSARYPSGRVVSLPSSLTDISRMAMQAAYFIIAVRAVGLAAGPMGGFDQAGLDADLFPDGIWAQLSRAYSPEARSMRR